MSAKEVYTYTCAQHSIGTMVRTVEIVEQVALKDAARTIGNAHFTNCWVKGCQMPLTQVRLVKDAGQQNAQSEKVD